MNAVDYIFPLSPCQFLCQHKLSICSTIFPVHPQDSNSSLVYIITYRRDTLHNKQKPQHVAIHTLHINRTPRHAIATKHPPTKHHTTPPYHNVVHNLHLHHPSTPRQHTRPTPPNHPRHQPSQRNHHASPILAERHYLPAAVLRCTGYGDIVLAMGVWAPLVVEDV